MEKKLSVISGVSSIEFQMSQTVLRYAMMPQSKSIYFNMNFFFLYLGEISRQSRYLHEIQLQTSVGFLSLERAASEQ